MSKLETGGAAQSLEEILASIRKSLDDESTGGLSKMSKPSAALATDARAPAAPAADGLSSRLAGALGGASTSVDGALADFFAHRPQKDQPAAEAPATPSAKPAEAKDPIWFLTRPGAAGDAAAGKGEAAPSPARDIASPSAPDEEVQLSRPETLRPSLPPLFAPDRPVSPGAAPAAAQPAVKAAGPRAEKAAEQAAPLKGDRPGPPLASATGSASPPAPPLASATGSTSPPAPATQSTVVPSAAQGPAPSAAQGPAPSAAQGLAPSAAQGLAPSAAQGPAPSAAQGPALEEMIAQLLEPVLVRWLDTNLPRMIEGVVRAEVDRALARGR